MRVSNGVVAFGQAVGMVLVLSGAASAQTLMPPGGITNDGNDMPLQPDESGLVLRMDRMENNLRQMNGQIEQLQFQNRQLQDALKKLQENGAAREPLRENSLKENPALAPAPVSPAKRSDAFDPAAQPNAPGAPRALGIGPAPGLALPKGAINPNEGGTPMDLAKSVTTTAGGTIIANGAPATPREEYDLAANFLKQGQYADAEAGFRSYLSKHPKDRLAPDATYYLGESFFQRSRPREAAEQFLKVSTDYPNSAKAPDSMLRLGLALRALDAKEQACATFQEIGRKYPNASTAVKRSAEREIAKNGC